MFTDTVTLYHKLCTGEYEIIPVEGVQWSDKSDKKNENGKLSVVRYAQITFPEGTYEDMILSAENYDGSLAVTSLLKEVKPGSKVC